MSQPILVEHGEATLAVDGAEIVARGGQIVVAADRLRVPLREQSEGELRLTAIQPGAEPVTEWLEEAAAREGAP